MNRSNHRATRIIMFMLLLSLWTSSLFTTPYLAKAQTEESIEEATPEATPETEASEGSFLGHIVQAGETLESIAALYHTTAEALAQENQLSLSAQLVPGQLLHIRSWDAQPVAPVAPDAVVAEPTMPTEEPQTDPQAEPQPEIQPQEVITGEKWIDVDLSEQMLIAYQGDTVVKSYSISSGVATHPTVTGSFRIWAKVALQDMTGGNRAAGDYYYTVDVPWVQYFYEDYSLHGAYWHDNFGYPMSHGCINMRVEEAKWLFDWATPSMDTEMVESGGWLVPEEGGTRVEVHE